MHYYFKLSYKYLFLRKASIKPYTKVIPAHGCLSLSLSTRVWDWRGDTCFNASTKGVTSRTSLRICSSKLRELFFLLKREAGTVSCNFFFLFQQRRSSRCLVTQTCRRLGRGKPLLVGNMQNGFSPPLENQIQPQNPKARTRRRTRNTSNSQKLFSSVQSKEKPRNLQLLLDYSSSLKYSFPSTTSRTPVNYSSTNAYVDSAMQGRLTAPFPSLPSTTNGAI